MMTASLSQLVERLKAGALVPYLGPGALFDVTHAETGLRIPALSDELILALNNGRPMAPKLMYEFPRAAMNIELKRGRRYVEHFLTRLYSDPLWSRAALHELIAAAPPAFVIDINRDTQLQDSYRDLPHLLVRGVARIAGTQYRFTLHLRDGGEYREIAPEDAPAGLPILMKPMGSPLPTPAFIASDADYVDYITELMGGFGLPSFLKQYRKARQYLFLGMRFSRDTERMVMSDICLDAAAPMGIALILDPTDKERRYCDRKGIEIVEAGVADFLAAAGVTSAVAVPVAR
jgi:hypothetical protein